MASDHGTLDGNKKSQAEEDKEKGEMEGKKEVDREESGKSEDKEDQVLEEEAKSQEKSEARPERKSTASSDTVSIEKEDQESDEVLNQESTEESQPGKEDVKLFTSSKKDNVEKEHEDTSLVAKEKMDRKKEPIESSTIVQGIGQASKKTKPEPSTSELRGAIVNIVLRFEPIYIDVMVMELGAQFDMDLTHRTAEVIYLLADIVRHAEMSIIEVSGDEEDDEEQNNREDAADKEEEKETQAKSEVKSTKESTKKRKETWYVSFPEELPGSKPKKAKHEENSEGSPDTPKSWSVEDMVGGYSEGFFRASLELDKRDRQERRKLQSQKISSSVGVASEIAFKEEDEVSKEESNEESQLVKEDEGTSLVAKEKTNGKKESIKSLTNDQGKGQATKEAKPEPSELELRRAVVDIVCGIGLQSNEHLFMELGARFKVDMLHRQEEVRTILSQVRRVAEMALIDESELEDDAAEGEKEDTVEADASEKEKEENRGEDDAD